LTFLRGGSPDFISGPLAVSPELERLRISRPGQEPPTAVFSRSRIILIVLGAVLLILAGLYLWGPLQPAQEVATTVVTRLYPAQAYTVLNASGYVVAQRKAAVSSKSTGRLAYLGVEEGSRVKKGQIIATLENEDLVAARDQAVAQVKQAEADLGTARAELVDARLQYRRYKTLVTQDLVAKQDFDTAVARYDKAKAGVAAAEARIKVARAGLASAQASLDYSYIRSPFDGVVTTKYADVGEVVAPFGAAANARAAVVTMADLHSLMVEVDVAESNLRNLPGRHPRAALRRRSPHDRPHRRPYQGHRPHQGEISGDGRPHPAGDERQGGLSLQTHAGR
jgi:RND family efflux transporter MFP subunit